MSDFVEIVVFLRLMKNLRDEMANRRSIKWKFKNNYSVKIPSVQDSHLCSSGTTSQVLKMSGS